MNQRADNRDIVCAVACERFCGACGKEARWRNLSSGLLSLSKFRKWTFFRNLSNGHEMVEKRSHTINRSLIVFAYLRLRHRSLPKAASWCQGCLLRKGCKFRWEHLSLLEIGASMKAHQGLIQKLSKTPLGFAFHLEGIFRCSCSCKDDLFDSCS